MSSKNKTQWLTEILLDLIISEGKTVRRPSNQSVDRSLRSAIADKVTNKEALIINNGEGYFVPGTGDAPAVREYISKERARAKAITDRADAVEEMFKETIKKALPEGSTTKTTYIVNENRGEINGHMES